MAYTCPSLEPDPEDHICAVLGEYDPSCTDIDCKERS